MLLKPITKAIECLHTCSDLLHSRGGGGKLRIVILAFAWGLGVWRTEALSFLWVVGLNHC